MGKMYKFCAALWVLALTVALKAGAVTVGQLEYELDEGTLTAVLTGPADASASIRNLRIPSSITVDKKSYSVTAIGECAFKGCSNLTGSLTIANTVTSIGDYAFYSCNGLTSTLSIPNAVTYIGEGAFMYCSRLRGSLSIPNSVATIGQSAFYDCGGFKGSLSLGNGVTTIGKSAFTYCSGLSGNLSIPNSVTNIEPYAFSGCSGLSGTLSLGRSVTAIGEYAFEGCGFSGSLALPAGITTIGAWAFNGCAGFSGELSIPESVVEIGKGAFSGCGFTGNLALPASLTAISSWVFNGCAGLTGTLTIGNTVTEIGDYAFAGCTGFDALSLGSAVESIYNKAFSNTRFQEITSLATVPPVIVKGEQYGMTAFDAAAYDAILYVPRKSLETYRMAYEWRDFHDIRQIGHIEAESISLSAEELSITIGETWRLTATILPEDATEQTIVWTSSNIAVARVDSDGVVTAKDLGQSIITATCGKLSATCVVTVLPIMAEELIVDPAEWSGVEGSTFTITATILPDNATMPWVEFASTDPEVATVDFYGNVEVLAEGSCSIIVTTVDGSGLSAQCLITSTSGLADLLADPDACYDVIDLKGVVLHRGITREELRGMAPGVYVLHYGDRTIVVMLR